MNTRQTAFELIDTERNRQDAKWGEPRPSDNEILTGALKKYGANAQIVMVFEEMAELQKELCKYLRGRQNEAEIAEEIADVRIMLDQMELLFGLDTESIRRKKLDRLSERVNKP